MDGSTVRQEPTAPTVRRISFFGLAEGDSTYHRGENVRVRIRFSQRIVVDTSGGEPYVDLVIGDETRRARFVRSATNRLDFAYTVQEGDADGDGVSVGANALALNGATVKSAADSTTDANPAHDPFDGGLAHKVDGSTARSPSVTVVTFQNSPTNGDTYGFGEQIVARVVFSDRVLVDETGGTPRLALTVGAQVRQATMSTPTGQRRWLDFLYTVQASDSAPQGVGIGANALALNGGTIKAAADSTTDTRLAHREVPPSATRKVAGSRLLPRLNHIGFLGPAPADSTFSRGDTIKALVEFDGKVVVDTTNGRPQVALTIGTTTRQAVLSAIGEEKLQFSYVVQATDMDMNGVGIAANALALGGSTIRGTDAAARAADITHSAVDGGAERKVEPLAQSSAPVVRTMIFFGLETGDSTYYRGDQIRVRVRFTKQIVVDTAGGSPYLDLTVGTTTRRARFVRSATNRLDFAYAVQATDVDTDGVSVGANALTLNGATVKAATDSTDADPAHGQFNGGLAHKVDGSKVRPPVVTSVAFRNSPDSGHTYGYGQEIVARVVFRDRVLVNDTGGTPSLALTVGAQVRHAAITTTRGMRRWLEFSYTVQASDRAPQGVGITANALALNGGTLKAAADSTTDAQLAHPAVPVDSTRKVNGSLGRSSPHVDRVSFLGSAPADSVYARDDTIKVQVGFNAKVAVDTTSGKPQVALTIGTTTRQAVLSAIAEEKLQFSYVVQATDTDVDGVSIAANALALEGATIRGTAAARAADIAHSSVDGGPTRKVDGSKVRSAKPTIISVAFAGLPPDSGTYHYGNDVVVRVSYGRAVVVDSTGGKPRLALTIGSQVRHAVAVVPDSATTALDFAYTVQSIDLDLDGVSIAASALALNGATINAATDSTMTASLVHDPVAAATTRRVDGRPRIVAMEFRYHTAPENGTFKFGETIRIQARFDQEVRKTGAPRVSLMVGADTVQVAARPGYAHKRHALEFLYQVPRAAKDSDGVSVPKGMLDLNGGTLTATDTAAQAKLDHTGIVARIDYKVDGDSTPRPKVRVTTFGRPADGGTYSRGETVVVRAVFHTPVVVSGRPQLTLQVGSQTLRKTAAYTGYWGVAFKHLVEAGDLDADGVSVPANSLSLNGATIRAFADSSIAPVLTHDSLPGASSYRVDGSKVGAPRVHYLTVASPLNDSVYTQNELFYLSVFFDRVVDVKPDTTTGAMPQLALSIGDSTRYATYSHRYLFNASKLVFSYTVQASDRDTVGLSIPANALSANGASITLADDTLVADLGHGEWATGHTVDGGRTATPQVRQLWFSSFPDSGTYRRGDSIHVVAAFDRPVAVDTTGGLPSMKLTIGDTTREAAYVGRDLTGTQLTFRYVVQATDRDNDGVSIIANVLRANGGLITVPSDTTTAILSHDPVAPDPGQKVDGALVAAVFGNRKPELVTPIAPKTLVLKSEPAADDLSAHFRDPDGDVLEFFVVSATEEVATVAVVDHLLTVRPRRPGKSIVTVRAADPQGAEVEHSFQVTVELSLADRTRILKHSLAAFGRTVGTEAVEAIGGRLREGDRENAHGQSHLRLGGRSFSCGASSGSNGCGLDGLARQAYGLLGVRLSPSLDRLASTLRRATGDGLDADAARGLADAFGAPGLGVHDMADAQRPRGNPELGRLLSIDPVWNRDFLSRASFRYSPGGETPSPDGDGQQSSPGGWTFWGQANTGGFEDRPGDDLALDGAVRSAFLGADYRFGRGPLVGLALSRTTSSIGFESGFAGNGTVDVNLTGAYPYVRWSPRPGLNVWGLLGAGRGDADMSEDATGRRFQTDVGMSMAAVGARQAVLGGLAFNADAFAVRTATDETRDLAAVAPSVYRLRFAPEVAGAWAASEQSSIRSRVELGVRLDGGEAAPSRSCEGCYGDPTGFGAEAGAEVAYAHRGIGLTVEARGRVLVAHQADAFRDWGASMSVRLEPRRQDGGLSFMLRPTWGNDASQLAALWRDGAAGAALARSATGTAGGANGRGWTANRLDIETGYAVAFSDVGRVAPFGRWTIAGGSEYRMNAGLRLSVMNKAGDSATQLLAVELFGQQASGDLGPTDARFGMQGELRFW